MCFCEFNPYSWKKNPLSCQFSDTFSYKPQMNAAGSGLFSSFWEIWFRDILHNDLCHSSLQCSFFFFSKISFTDRIYEKIKKMHFYTLMLNCRKLLSNTHIHLSWNLQWCNIKFVVMFCGQIFADRHVIVILTVYCIMLPKSNRNQ